MRMLSSRLDPWRFLPPVVRAVGLRWVAIVLGSIPFVALAMYWLFQNRNAFAPPIQGALVGVTPFIPLFVAMGMTIPRMRRIKREFETSGGRCCTHCAHDLSGLGDQGKCPECGGDFDCEIDREAWRAAGWTLPKPTSHSGAA